MMLRFTTGVKANRAPQFNPSQAVWTETKGKWTALLHCSNLL